MRICMLYLSFIILFCASCGNDTPNNTPPPEPEKKPFISEVTGAPCSYGSTVVINGINFSPAIADQKVMFGELEAEIIKATKTSLTVITPKLGEVSSVDVKVIMPSGTSNAKKILVDEAKNYIATYAWTTQTVRPGIIYKTAQLNLFNATRRIHILDVTLNATSTLGIGVASLLKSTVGICNDYQAVAGINAGYFPMGSTDKDPYIRINGTTIQVGHPTVDALFTNAALLIQDNVATIRKLGTGTNLNSVASQIPLSQARDIIVCGPMLITNGVIESLDMNRSHNTSSTARTGLGVSADGKRVLMVVVDYNDGATGMSTLQLATLLRMLGAENAMNFDGGGSSTMFVKEMGDNGRVSHNTYSQRNVHSIIYVK